jgi:hypothetical protein
VFRGMTASDKISGDAGGAGEGDRGAGGGEDPRRSERTRVTAATSCMIASAVWMAEETRPVQGRTRPPRAATDRGCAPGQGGRFMPPRKTREVEERKEEGPPETGPSAQNKFATPKSQSRKPSAFFLRPTPTISKVVPKSQHPRFLRCSSGKQLLWLKKCFRQSFLVGCFKQISSPSTIHWWQRSSPRLGITYCAARAVRKSSAVSPAWPPVTGTEDSESELLLLSDVI